MPLKRGTFFVFVVLAILAAVFLVYGYYSMTPAKTPQPLVLGQASSTTPTVTIATDEASQTNLATVAVEVESTPAAREQGLSGRASLALGSGMLFVFQKPCMDGFWMKDMNFALDMLFADANGKIVTIVHNATPDSYNAQDPQLSKVFYPSSPILYVLEVPAGFADAHKIKEGMVMQVQ